MFWKWVGTRKPDLGQNNFKNEAKWSGSRNKHLSRCYFCPESVVCFLRLAENIQVHFRLDFIMEANTMNPDQTAPQGSHQSKTSYKYMIWHSDEKLF